MGEIMQKPDYTEEISLLEMFDTLKSRRKFIFWFTGIITVIALVYALVATPMYSSYVSIYPSLEDSSMSSALGDFQGIASAIGISMDGAGPLTFYIPDIVNSRMLRKSVVLSTWTAEHYSAPVGLITYWEIDDPTKITKRILRFVTGIFSKKKVDPQRRYTENAMSELGSRISIREEDSGLTTIIVSMEEPQLASDIANFIANEIKTYIREEQGKQSKKYREFIEGRLSESKSELSKSEEELTSFRKEHPIALDTPERQLDRGRMMRNIEVNQEVYITLRQQHELARIEELRETTAINILDEAEPPVKHSAPRRILILTGSFIFGLFISVIIVLIKFSVQRERAAA